MTRSSETSSSVVVDAGFAVLAALPYPTRDRILQQFRAWRQDDARILAPALWLGEAVSVIRKQIFFKALTPEEGRTAVGDLLALEIETVPLDRDLCQGALVWAERLGQARAYDGFYLALAERYQAEFWTLDQRLGRGLQETEADLVVRSAI